MNRGLRIMLLLVYAGISMITCVLLQGYGPGTYHPFSIMASWGDVALRLWGPLLENYYSFLICVTFLVYPLGIVLLNNTFRRFVHTPIPIPTLAIHSVGSIISLVLAGKQPTYYFSRAVKLLAWTLPLIIVITYLILDWRLARGSGKPEHAGVDK